MGVPFFGPLMKKIFGSRNQRMVKRFERIVDQVNALESSTRTLTDAQLKAKTEEFRARIKKGEKPFALMPEVFAVAREAMDRAVGIRNIFDPTQKFDPSTLPANVRDLYARTKAEMDAAPVMPPEGDFRGCSGGIAGWQYIDIPLPIYEAVREILPDSRPPFRARPFDVQIIGGTVLTEGRIAEMKTGEGKTIVAPLACYLACCEKKQVHVVTVNDYLVQRDRDWTFPFFRALGLTVGCIHPMHMQHPQEKQAAYSCDVVYGTTSEFGFDYLRDNMKVRQEEQLQKHREFAIVDEVDSTLIDEARTPLIISGPAHANEPRYDLADRLARHLVAKQSDWDAANEKVQACLAEIAACEGDIRTVRDREKVPELKSRMDAARKRLPQLESERDKYTQYFEVELDKKRTTPTHDGITEAQKVAGMGSFYVGDNIDMPHLLEQSLRAHTVYQRDRDYVVSPDDQGIDSVIIVDQSTGRKMIGRQWSDGLHQAVEAKEGVRIKEETQTMATITIQNYFKMYPRLAGMTGTADTEATEFHEIYRLDVVSIPTNVQVARIDLNDVVFMAQKDKWEHIVDEIHRMHDAGRPVLVGTTSVEKSEMLSQMLTKKYGIKHEVLNAKQHDREAEIVAGAGQLGAVMIATNMAGRGTDIKLGRISREQLIDHWKRRNVCPHEVRSDWPDDQIIQSCYRHMAGRKFGKQAIEGKDDSQLKLELLRAWAIEQRVPEKTAAKMPESELVDFFDAIVFPPLHRLTMWQSVEDMGGLHIIGTERHESRRIDNQLRGRAGRQGDNGSSRFFLALDDDLMKLFMGKAALNAMSRLGLREGEAMELGMLTRTIEKAQRKVEERNFQIRKNILEYDEPMEYQRRGFYGLRQPIVESRGVRTVIVSYIEDAAGDACKHYLGRDYVPSCIANWVRDRCGFSIEAERFRGKDRSEIHKLILTDCLEESSSVIRVTVGEYMSEELDRTDWDMLGFANWVKATFDAEIDAAKFRNLDQLDVIRQLEAAAERKYNAIDLSPLDQYLVPNYGQGELAQWTTRTFGIPCDPKEFALSDRAQKAGIDNVDEATTKLVQIALNAYRERELTYPIEYAIEVTSAMLQSNPAAALGQFCMWVKWRYELEWTPEALPSNVPQELRDMLIKEAKSWDDARIAKRAAKAVGAAQSATDSEARGKAIDAWFQEHCAVRLSDLEREEAAENPQSFCQARIAELLRTEVTQFERWVLLQILDVEWKDHLHGMDQIRDSIGFRAFSQKDPRIEFKKESSRLFHEMQEGVRDRVTELVLKGRLPVARPRQAPQAQASSDAAVRAAAEADAAQRAATEVLPAAPALSAAANLVRGSAQQEADLAIAERAGMPAGARPATTVKTDAGVPVVGRNEPCPCGSGKKYKQCHGAKQTA
ncbi:MAG: preprotein translocase subunit SecA [Phycisphaerae bacterium]|nr:preprotein translocase subunit SecA [Phycisphaerae bacterium]